MDYSNKKFQEEIYKAIREEIPERLKILFICLTGSRGKNLASNESDFDVRVITQSPLNDYIFKHTKETIKLRTDISLNGKDQVILEGQAVDILKVFDYALETNSFMLDLLRGIPLYSESDEVIDQLRLTYKQLFRPDVPFRHLKG